MIKLRLLGWGDYPELHIHIHKAKTLNSHKRVGNEEEIVDILKSPLFAFLFLSIIFKCVNLEFVQHSQPQAHNRALIY